MTKKDRNILDAAKILIDNNMICYRNKYDEWNVDTIVGGVKSVEVATIIKELPWEEAILMANLNRPLR